MFFNKNLSFEKLCHRINSQNKLRLYNQIQTELCIHKAHRPVIAFNAQVVLCI